jgi:2-polyprenyl-3-methyl-5-hydroxy-6-metoxy-1,4-benzoquinol methylase
VQTNNVAGNYYDKYGSANPAVRWIMRGFFSSFDRLASASRASSAHEIGCGEGTLAIRLARKGMKVRGCDVSDEIVTRAGTAAAGEGLEIAFQAKSIYSLRIPDDAEELIVCCEVLEHLPDPGSAVDILASLAQPYLIASVPREPLWRFLNICRGNYLRDFGNTPGHLQHWSKKRFLELMNRRFEVVSVETPLPWTMALFRVRSRRGPS